MKSILLLILVIGCALNVDAATFGTEHVHIDGGTKAEPANRLDVNNYENNMYLKEGTTPEKFTDNSHGCFNDKPEAYIHPTEK